MSKCFLIDSDDKYTLNQRICSLRTKMLAGYFIYQISRNKYFMKFDDRSEEQTSDWCSIVCSSDL